MRHTNEKGACIVEITSVKTEIFKSLSRIPDSLTVLSIHPMFGPGAKEHLQYKNIDDTN